FYTEKLDDLRQRREALQHIGQSLAELDSDTPPMKLRMQQIRAELAAIAALRARNERSESNRSSKARKGSASKSNAPKSKPHEKHQFRKRVICVVDTHGFVYCAPEVRLTDLFMAGYWTDKRQWVTTQLDDGRAYQVLHWLDQIADRFGLDLAK